MLPVERGIATQQEHATRPPIQDIDDMTQFVVALAVLTLVHSVVSLAAHRLFTESTVLSRTKSEPIETSTPEQRESGKITFTSTGTMVVLRSRPTVVTFYMWAGYIGLAAAAISGLCYGFRTAN
jgi:hypothetical protein